MRSLLGLQIYPMYLLLLPESTDPCESQRFRLDVPHIHFNTAASLFQQSTHTALQYIVTADTIVRFLLFYCIFFLKKCYALECSC